MDNYQPNDNQTPAPASSEVKPEIDRMPNLQTDVGVVESVQGENTLEQEHLIRRLDTQDAEIQTFRGDLDAAHGNCTSPMTEIDSLHSKLNAQEAERYNLRSKSKVALPSHTLALEPAAPARDHSVSSFTLNSMHFSAPMPAPFTDKGGGPLFVGIVDNFHGGNHPCKISPELTRSMCRVP